MATTHEIERAKAAAIGVTLLSLAELADGMAILGARLEYAEAAGITVRAAGQEIDLLTYRAVMQALALAKQKAGRDEHHAEQIKKALDAAAAHVREVRALPDPESRSIEELEALTQETARLTDIYAKAAGLGTGTAIARVFNEADKTS